MPKITLLLGPVGAGKTTFALDLAGKAPAVFFNLDEWMTILYSDDRPQDNIIDWYVSRAGRCKKLILAMTERSLASGLDVILEIGLLKKEEREQFYHWVKQRRIELEICVFDVERSVRRQWVLARNAQQGANFSMEVPPSVFEFASDLWEPVSADEVAHRLE